MINVAFFNNKGGVGKTSLVYHLAWMFANYGVRVLVADLDPQANLTSMFIDDEHLELLWENQKTVQACLRPIVRGTGGIGEPHLEIAENEDRIAILPGDLELSGIEGELSTAWNSCLASDQSKYRGFSLSSAFAQVIRLAAAEHQSAVALIDVGPNLGTINRAALVASDYVVTPLGPDLFSLQGLRNLGSALQTWRDDWHRRLENVPDDLGIELPDGLMQPVGYVVMRHSIRLDRPVKAYERWIERIPQTFHEYVLDETLSRKPIPKIEFDPYCLAQLRDYRSLMSMAQEAHKPMFALKPADGAIGGHQEYVAAARRDFANLAQRIAQQIHLPSMSGFAINAAR